MTDHHLSPDDQRLDALQRAVDGLPRDVTPAADAWPAIRARIEAAQVVPMGASPQPVQRRSSNRWRVAAAAAVLVVGSSAATVLVMRGEANAPATAVASPGAGDAAPFSNPGATLPGSGSARPVVLNVWANYDAASADLERVLQARRSRLSPATVQAVEESLRTIDRAIGEARAALEKDPASRDLMDLLDSVYRQKLDLLRRANELPLRSS